MTYAKALVALVIAGFTAAASALTDGQFTSTEKVQVAIAVATAAGVLVTANVPTLVWAKAAIAALLAGLNAVVVYLGFGTLTHAEWLNVALAVVTVIGVYLAPNSATRTIT
jgi:hypothetical protein